MCQLVCIFSTPLYSCEQVQWVQTRFTIVIDDDVIFTRNTRIEHLIDALKQNPSVGLVGGIYEVSLCLLIVAAIIESLSQAFSVS